MNQNQYWSKVEEFKLSCNDIPDTVVRLRSGLEYIKQQKYDGVVALTASILQNELSGENSWVKKCDIANLLVDTYRSRGTVYKAIAETAEVLQWTPKFANGKYPFAFQPKYYEEDNSGYIDLNKYEIESLFSIVQLCSGERHYTKKESDAVKLYLYLKSDIRIKNRGARSRWYRRYSITGDYGLAATLGFKPSYDRGIKTALSLLEEVGLLTYTSDVVAPNKAGKCLVVNAMMCDKENFWYSADYQSKIGKQGFSIFKQGPQSPTSMSIGNSNENIDYNDNEDIQDSGPMFPSFAPRYDFVNSGQESVNNFHINNNNSHFSESVDRDKLKQAFGISDDSAIDEVIAIENEDSVASLPHHQSLSPIVTSSPKNSNNKEITINNTTIDMSKVKGAIPFGPIDWNVHSSTEEHLTLFSEILDVKYNKESKKEEWNNLTAEEQSNMAYDILRELNFYPQDIAIFIKVVNAKIGDNIEDLVANAPSSSII